MRQTSSRGMSSSQQKVSSSGGVGGLETIQSLPDGFDPIFNPTSNTNFLTSDKSNIKVKPMKPSKGFDQIFEFSSQNTHQIETKTKNEENKSSPSHYGKKETSSSQYTNNERAAVERKRNSLNSAGSTSAKKDNSIASPQGAGSL